MSDRPAGWYDDPNNPEMLRYWDGVVWTDHVTPRAGIDASTSAGGSSAGPDSASAPGQQSWGQQGQAGTPPGGGQEGQQQWGQQSPPPWGQPPQQPWAQQGPPQQQWGQEPQSGWGQQPGQQPPPQWGQQQQWGGQPMIWGPNGKLVPATPDGVPLSGWWRRVGAYILDGLLVGILLNVVLSMVAGSFVSGMTDKMGRYLESVVEAAERGSGQAPVIPADLNSDLMTYGLLSALAFLLWELGWLVWKGTSPGRMATGIAVRLEERPGPLPLAAAVARTLVKLISQIFTRFGTLAGLAQFFMIADYLWPLWDKKNQALHDKVGKTVVVRRIKR